MKIQLVGNDILTGINVCIYEAPNNDKYSVSDTKKNNISETAGKVDITICIIQLGTLFGADLKMVRNLMFIIKIA